MRCFAAIAVTAWALLLAGCGSDAVRPAPAAAITHHTHAAAASHAGVAVVAGSSNPDQDGPPSPDEIPPDVASIPDAVPQVEPLSELGNPDSYEVYGDQYVILKDGHGYRERGYASWYGKKFQGKHTSSGEAYDMFKMTAAHKTLPIPCYARVTNMDSGKSVIVRINDRGPFHSGRIIDLSYTAAIKLGVLGKGSIPVEVAWIDPSMPTPATQYAAAPAAKLASAQPLPAAARPPAPVVVAAAPPPMAVAAPPPQSQPVPQPTAAAMPQPAAAAAPGGAAVMVASAAPAVSPTTATPEPLARRFLQAGLFADPINAVTMRAQLNGMGIPNVLLKNDTRNGASISRVLIGPFLDDGALAAVRKRLSEVQMPSVPVPE